jgi:hypothetical protein
MLWWLVGLWFLSPALLLIFWLLGMLTSSSRSELSKPTDAKTVRATNGLLPGPWLSIAPARGQFLIALNPAPTNVGCR